MFALVTLAGVWIPDSSSRTNRNYIFAYALAVLGIPIVKLVANLDLPAYALAFSFVPVFVVRAVLHHCTDAFAVEFVPNLIYCAYLWLANALA